MNRFQLVVAGSETKPSPETGKIVGWKLEFMSCQAAETNLMVNDTPLPLQEGLRIPQGANVRLAFKGDATATVQLTLVLDKTS